jgi:hypothetical protein
MGIHHLILNDGAAMVSDVVDVLGGTALMGQGPPSAISKALSQLSENCIPVLISVTTRAEPRMFAIR